MMRYLATGEVPSLAAEDASIGHTDGLENVSWKCLRRRTHGRARLGGSVTHAERLPLRSLATRREAIERHVDADALPRFRRLCELEGSIHARLSFGLDDEGYIRIAGTLAASVRVACQRCLDATPVDLNAGVRVVVATNEADATRLGGKGDVVVVATPEPTLAELIEDELILTLPMRPCARRNCGKAPPFAYPSAAQCQRNPFASLAELNKG